MLYEEMVKVITSLFDEHGVEYNSSRLKDWLACIDFESIQPYFDSIGLHINNKQIQITDINFDDGWTKVRLQLINDFFIGVRYEDVESINNT